ncbi:MAG TPA: hypothetical protein VN176_16220 [Verrucomicrobiae bacterium]|jgi:hypothetical protein|nr:hypothetical protein [Verrucomicrobiae bacterium]
MSDDTQKTKPSFEKVGRKLDEAAQKLDQESEKVVAYLNDEVVPAIRTRSTKALRTAAEQLAKLADYMDRERSS